MHNQHMNNGEGMPKPPSAGRRGEFGYGVGWQGSKVEFEVNNATKPYEATAWDEDVCVAAFTTRSRLALLVCVWWWHFKFNRRSNHPDGSQHG